MTGFPGPGQEPYGDMVKQYIDTGDSLNTVALASKADLVSGTVPDAQIPAAITRDSEMATALAGKADLVSGTVPDAQIPAAITRDSELTTAINGLSATYGTVVAHGSTAGTARPSDATQVLWKGTVSPTNGADGDVWLNTSTGDEKVRVSGSFVFLNSTHNDASYAPVVEVSQRVASEAAPWTPLLLPSLLGWYDAGSLSGANGSAVATWPDLSGNGMDMVSPTWNLPISQSPAFTSPTLVNASQNAQPVVRFDGSGNVLQMPLTPLLNSGPTSIQSLIGPITVFMAARATLPWPNTYTSDTGLAGILLHMGGAGSVIAKNSGGGAGIWSNYQDDAGSSRSLGGSLPPVEGLMQTITAIWDGTSGGSRTPSVPASAAYAANNTDSPVAVYLSGGTITAISVSTTYGGSAPASNVFSLPVTTPIVMLAPYQAVAITYSVAPTWTWVPSGPMRAGATLRVNGYEMNDVSCRQPKPTAITLGAVPPTHGGTSGSYGGYQACDIAEIIILNKAATDAEINLVERYLTRGA